MKIVITGGAGRLGPFIVRDILQRGHEVLCLDTTEPAEKNCPSLAVDLRETDKLIKALEGADAVIHLARRRFPYTSNGFDLESGLWKYPDVAQDAERFGHNVTLTYNFLAASVAAGVRKLICGSSLAVYGLYYPCRPLAPEYLPVDEDHPLKPQDPYGLTKLVGENLCAAFAASRGIQIASMRFSGIASADQYPTLRKRQKEPLIRGTGALWSFVDVRDAAVVCRLAVERDFSGHQAFNICAGRTIMKEDTSELVSRYLPGVKFIKSGLVKNWCAYDSSKAESMLGFRAVHLLED
ncbi:MAG TPA: NAD(P)-dependent oxidoreductase [Candidatus Limnocylindrales bacterium]|nr:NAD(P)-dependent oxidoreductase [Candidatus Limnocylindrales bacterium]